MFIRISTLAVLALGLLPQSAFAHFPWIVKDDAGKVVLFFGENLADRTYKLPPSIAKAELRSVSPKGEAHTLSTKAVESEALVGLVSDEAVAADQSIATEVTFGIYGGSKLHYYCTHLAKLPKSREAYRELKLDTDLSAQVVDTDSGVEVYVTWKGQPLQGLQVQLSCDEGHEEGSAETDADGKVSFTDKQIEDGVNGLMFGHTIEEAGKVNGKEYAKAAYYMTVTFPDSATK